MTIILFLNFNCSNKEGTYFSLCHSKFLKTNKQTLLSIYYTCHCCAEFDIEEQLRSVIDHSVSGQTGKKSYCVG